MSLRAIFAAVLLFWSSLSWSALAPDSIVPVVRCPDGYYWAPSVGECPGHVEESALISRTGEAATFEFTVDARAVGGSLEYFVSQSPTPPTTATIISGAGAVASGQTAVGAAGAVSVSFSGLTSGQDYYIHSVVAGGPRPTARGVIRTAQFNSGPTSVSSNPAAGCTHYVSSVSGNDANSGTAMGNAWKTLAKVGTSVSQTSSRVCLLPGSTWKERITPDWNGVEGNMSGLMAVYVDQGDGNKVVRYDSGTGTGRGARPKIGEDLTVACIAAANCSGSPTDYFQGRSVNSGYRASVDIQADWFEVSGLEVIRAPAIGIQVKGTGYGAAHAGSRHHVVIQDNKVSYVGKQGIVAMNGAQDIVIRRNEVHNHSQCYTEMIRNGVFSFSTRAGICDGGAWGGSLLVARTVNGRILVENNTVHNIMGEGIGVGQGATDVLVRGNRGYNSHSTTLYSDMALRVIFESNIIGGPDTGGAGDYSGGSFGPPFGGGYAANVEKDTYGNNECTIWRNNAAVDGPAGVRMNVFNDAGAYAAGLAIANAAAYGNTFVSMDGYGVRMNRRITSFEMKSNILSTDDIGAAAMCSFAAVDPGFVFDFSHNSYSTAPSNGICASVQDVGGATLARSDSYYDLVDYATRPMTFDDFRLQPGSAGIGAGDPDLDDEPLPCGITHANYGTFIWAYTEYPFAYDTPEKLANFGLKLKYDAEGNIRHPTAPDMGLLNFTAP